VEEILNISGLNRSQVRFRPTQHPALHPGISAEIIYQDQGIGYLGALHPAIQMEIELDQQVYVFQLHVKGLSQQITTKYRKLSKYPLVKRDLAVVVDEDIPVDRIVQCIMKSAPETLINLELFDVYHGEGIDLGKKSLAIGLTFQRTSSTLTDEEVEGGLRHILSGIKEELGGELREKS
jgi:Phenylalanyl-tRNA synthetase beta subunit